ncbi:MAG: LuxR C-terminal-related transcriptional regulator, partial [Ilumatobacteraceae bacterium]
RVVAAGEALLAPSITRRLIEDFVKRPIDSTPDPRLDQLTGREREVLIEVARGLSNAELSEKLFMSHATAKTHVSHLLTKFAVRDRAQLVVAAYETGLVARGRT